MVVNNEVVVQDIIKSIRKNSGQFLREIKIFDVYRGKQVKEGCQSIAFSLSFGADDRTLTDQEVNSILAEVSSKLSLEFGVELRA
ncbi:MAG: hypothetical protein HGA27_04490 [Peptococcaceae bacterium]|nr:hypothetical protein [Peptococcaceae bacterium]